MESVTCCLANRGALEEVEGQLVGRTFVHVVRSRSEVATSVKRYGSIAVFADIIDPVAGPLASALRVGPLQDLQVPVIAVARPVGSEVAAIALTIQAGAADILLLGIDDVSATLARAITIVPGGTQALNRALIASGLSAESSALLAACITEASRGGTVDSLARRVGQSVQTLHRRCRRERLPSPGKLLRWIRVMLALGELTNESMSQSEVAHRVGYASAGPLRAGVRDFAGVDLKDLRSNDSLGRALERLMRSLLNEAKRTRERGQS